MMNFWIVILVVTLIVNSTNGKSHSTCNDDCLTKTYCLSSDGSNVCSKNNLVTAKWFVVQQKQGDDIIGFTLNGQGIKSTDEKLISLTFQSPSSSKFKTNYSCYKSALGATSAQVETYYAGSTQTITKGSSSYSNNVLSCTWSFTRYEDIYPLFYASTDLINDSNYQLVLQYGAEATGTMVAIDTTGLPIYHLQYLNCCYKVHGNDNYLIIFNQTTDNQYLIQTIKVFPNKMSISLTDATGTQLLFTCDAIKKNLPGWINYPTESKSISDQIYATYISSSRCSWAHPLVLVSSLGQYDTTNGVYDLQITANDVVVYTEKGVKLRNSASKLFSWVSMILVACSLLLNASI